MTVNIPGSSVVEIKLDMIELKLDRLIDEMRCLRSRTSAFNTRMRSIEAYLASEPSEQQPESKITPWLEAALGDALRSFSPLAYSLGGIGPNVAPAPVSWNVPFASRVQ
jgi:hypothetical protein